jgi:DNA-binding XRE family transcriptional regulator
MKASNKTRIISKALEVSQNELLNILIDRYGTQLINEITSECLGCPTKIAVRQWLKNNTASDRRKIAHETKAARYRKNLTQKDLAQLMDVGVQAVVNFENCKAISQKKALLAASVLQDIPLNQLLFEVGWIDRF